MTRFRRLVAVFSLLRPVFDLMPVHMRFVADIIALGQLSVQVLLFSNVCIIPPLLHMRSSTIDAV